MADAILTGVTIVRDAFGDPRYHYLAQLCRLANNFEALGRMAMLWSLCTAMQSETPPRAKIVVCLGADGPEALVAADLGELLVDGTIRVKGCRDHTGWYGDSARRGEAGGKARAAEAVRDERGHFKPRDPVQREPANTSESSEHQHKIKDQDPDQESEELGVTVERARGRARTPTGNEMPEDWHPAATDKNRAAAETAAKERAVHVEHALAKFVERAKAQGTRARDWDAAWRGWLLTEHPPKGALRDVLVQGTRKITAQAARDRERLDIERRDQLAKADRDECIRAANEFLTQKATG